MMWKPIIIQMIIFVITLLLSRVIIELIQRYLLEENYKLTKRFSHAIICLIVVIAGIISGREILYVLL
ncbi:hypothetical protein ACSVC9_05760 [Clostridium sp. LBM24168]